MASNSYLLSNTHTHTHTRTHTHTHAHTHTHTFIHTHTHTHKHIHTHTHAHTARRRRMSNLTEEEKKNVKLKNAEGEQLVILSYYIITAFLSVIFIILHSDTSSILYYLPTLNFMHTYFLF